MPAVPKNGAFPIVRQKPEMGISCLLQDFTVNKMLNIVLIANKRPGKEIYDESNYDLGCSFQRQTTEKYGQSRNLLSIPASIYTNLGT